MKKSGYRPMGRGTGRAGPAVAVTRPVGEEEADPLVEAFQAEGCDPLPFPLLRVETDGGGERIRGRLAAPWKAALASQEDLPHAWLVITSRNTIGPLQEAMSAEELDPRVVQGAGLRVAAVGPSTAAGLASVGWVVNLIPEESTAEGLVAALKASGTLGPGVRVALPQADVARSTLRVGIRDIGAHVDAVVAYQVVEDEAMARSLCEALSQGQLAGVALTSGRAASALAKAWRKFQSERGEGGSGGEFRSWPDEVVVGVLGPVTEAQAVEGGLPVTVRAARSTLPELAQVMAVEMIRHSHQNEALGDV